MKAVLPFDVSTQLARRIRDCHELDVVAVDPADLDTLAAELHDAALLLHVLEPVTSDIIAMGPRLRLIQKIGVGTDTIDLAAARAAGVAVANMPGTNTQAVVEHTLSLMLATLRRIVQFHGSLLSHEGWSAAATRLDPAIEMHGRTVGLVGFGAISSALARLLRALGCNVIFYNRTPRHTDVARQVSLHELLELSDIVSLHVPSTPQTRHLLDHDALCRMKPGVVLINTARGDLVDEACLVRLLRCGHISAAGLDVFEDERVRDLADLLACPTVTVTPHVAWLTSETIERSRTVILDNTRRLVHGLALRYRVA